MSYRFSVVRRPHTQRNGRGMERGVYLGVSCFSNMIGFPAGCPLKHQRVHLPVTQGPTVFAIHAWQQRQAAATDAIPFKARVSSASGKALQECRR